MAKRQLILNAARARQRRHRELVQEIASVLRPMIDGDGTPDMEERLSALRLEDERNSGMAYAEATKAVAAACGWKVTCH